MGGWRGWAGQVTLRVRGPAGGNRKVMDELESLDLKAVPELVEGFLWEELDDGCVIYHEATGQMVTLNGTAEGLLSCCFGSGTLDDVLCSAEAEFGISSADGMAGLRLLLKEGVIRLVLPS